MASSGGISGDKWRFYEINYRLQMAIILQNLSRFHACHIFHIMYNNLCNYINEMDYYSGIALQTVVDIGFIQRDKKYMLNKIWLSHRRYNLE